jgi:hypothetical protein
MVDVIPAEPQSAADGQVAKNLRRALIEGEESELVELDILAIKRKARYRARADASGRKAAGA